MAKYESDTADAEFVVKVLTDYLNNFGSHEEEFVEGLGRQHRTLQQGATRLFVKWFRKLREDNLRPSGGLVRNPVDDRNEASVILARKMFDALDESDFFLPCI